MPASFPGSIFSPRVIVDRAGAVYDALKTKVFFAQDHNDPLAEILAIETVLGISPAGAFTTVGLRIAALEAAGPGVTDFLGLSDVPASYSGAGGQVVAVNVAENALEFIPAPGGAVDSVNTYTGAVVLDPDDLDDSATINKFTTSGEISKLAGIESGAEVNNISDANATDLTDGGATALHTHAGIPSGAPTVVQAKVDVTYNNSSAGTTRVDTIGNTYGEHVGQTRLTLPSIKKTCCRIISGHVSAGTGTFELFNFTDSTSLGTTTTTNTSEAILSAGFSSLAGNISDAITIRTKNSGAGGSCTIDGGGIAQCDIYCAPNGSAGGYTAFTNIVTPPGYFSAFSCLIIKQRSDKVINGYLACLSNNGNNDSFTQMTDSFTQAQSDSPFSLVPYFKVGGHSRPGSTAYNNPLVFFQVSGDNNGTYFLFSFEAKADAI